MYSLSYISKYMEKFAPLYLAEPWDNCGWQIFIDDIKIDKVLLTLSITNDTINFAEQNGYKIVIAHHPLLFTPIKSIHSYENLAKIIIKAIKSDISIYCMHTNLDKVEKGVSDLLSNKLGMIDCQPILPDKTNNQIGLGRYGILKEPVYIDNFLNKIKNILEIEYLKITNYNKTRLIKTIALCGGSGGSLICNLPENTDVFITGDIKYHDVVDISNLIVIDANHHNTEMPILKQLQKYLYDININSTIFKAENPWQIL